MEQKPSSFSIMVSLTGNKATTGKMNLQKNISFWYDSNNKSSCPTYDDYVIACDLNLGYVRVIGIDINYKYLPDNCAINWRIDYIDICNFQDKSNITHFPCYKWIGNSQKGILCTPARRKITCVIW